MISRRFLLVLSALQTVAMRKLDFQTGISDISAMTEIPDKTSLRPAVERFILHWGEMGGQWGVNRSVSQIHALLYLSERPLTAEEISDVLGMARSNVSTSIKELFSWNLIRRVPVMGDRRDQFEAETDVWEIARRIAAGRKEREIDPAIKVLDACVAEAAQDARVSPAAHERLSAMLAFTKEMAGWYDQMRTVPTGKLAALVRLGARIVNLLPMKRVK